MDTLNQIDISIIIPIYNVEKYLTVCIDSLKNQGGLRMEIILVNDGSTDLSGEIADEYAKKEERIKVIHQENGGASAARNVGLDIATEEYIAFLDSDDLWKKEKLEKRKYKLLLGDLIEDKNMVNPSEWDTKICGYVIKTEVWINLLNVFPTDL